LPLSLQQAGGTAMVQRFTTQKKFAQAKTLLEPCQYYCSMQ
jgi:hypothetical protein